MSTNPEVEQDYLDGPLQLAEEMDSDEIDGPGEIDDEHARNELGQTIGQNGDSRPDESALGQRALDKAYDWSSHRGRHAKITNDYWQSVQDVKPNRSAHTG